MSEVWKALGFISLGVIVTEWYNLRMWHKYYEGQGRRGR